MIVDAHVHIFPPEVIADRTAYPDEAAFNLLYTDERARLITAEELIESMDRDGVAWSVVCSFPWRTSAWPELTTTTFCRRRPNSPIVWLPCAG